MTQTTTTAASAPSGHIFIAMFWMAMAVLSFSIVAITGREAGKGIDTMHMMFYRSLIALCVVIAIVPFTRTGIRQLATARLGRHTLRNVLHFIAQYSWLSALMLIPLAQLISIEFTAPLWVALLAPLVLKERLTAARVLAAGLGFAGVLIIVRPGSVPVSAGTAFALLAALGFACSMIATKQLVRTDSVWSILFHMSWIQLLIAGLIISPDARLPSPETMFWIAGVGLAGMSAHFSLARAFAHADAIVVAPMDFMRLPVMMLVGYLLYAEALDPIVAAGASIVVAGNLINILSERRRAAAQS